MHKNKNTELLYDDLLKVEFLDMLRRFTESREYFHAYSISRMCTHGTMIGFDYGYFTFPNDDNHIGKFLDLKEFGTIRFKIDCTTNYGQIVSKNSDDIIENFLSKYPTVSKITSSRTKIS